MSARDLAEVLKKIQSRCDRPRLDWRQELEADLINFRPDYLEAADLISAMCGHFTNLKAKAGVAVLIAMLEKADHEPDETDPDDAFDSWRSRQL